MIKQQVILHNINRENLKFQPTFQKILKYCTITIDKMKIFTEIVI